MANMTQLSYVCNMLVILSESIRNTHAIRKYKCDYIFITIKSTNNCLPIVDDIRLFGIKKKNIHICTIHSLVFFYRHRLSLTQFSHLHMSKNCNKIIRETFFLLLYRWRLFSYRSFTNEMVIFMPLLSSFSDTLC